MHMASLSSLQKTKSKQTESVSSSYLGDRDGLIEHIDPVLRSDARRRRQRRRLEVPVQDQEGGRGDAAPHPDGPDHAV